jgi:hypothetical protein
MRHLWISLMYDGAGGTYRPLLSGHGGCCDASMNKHATKLFHGTGHPIVRSCEWGEDWLWCYFGEVGMALES